MAKARGRLNLELFMRTKLRSLFIVLALLVGIHQAAAQGAQFFRISGPTATTIASFRLDGTLVWSNAQPGATYTVQTVSSLLGGTTWVDYVQIPTTSGVNTNQLIDFNPPAGMVLIPAGMFTMGDNLQENSLADATPTNVTVSAFYMDVNLVSYSQWQSVYNWATNRGFGFVNAGSGKATNHPVQTVDWYDCVKWCNARSQQAGLTPVYYTNVSLTQVYTNGETSNVFVNWTNSGFRLPTEAEWEKAARAGQSGLRFPWGDTISESQSNYRSNTNLSYDLGPSGFNENFAIGATPYTSPAGAFPPNAYGLCDMAGNEVQWCWDWYAAPPYPPGSPYLGGSDPRGLASGNVRVVRGGNWGANPYQGRCANRSYGIGPNALNVLGFRCVRGH